MRIIRRERGWMEESSTPRNHGDKPIGEWRGESDEVLRVDASLKNFRGKLLIWSHRCICLDRIYKIGKERHRFFEGRASGVKVVSKGSVSLFLYWLHPGFSIKNGLIWKQNVCKNVHDCLTKEFQKNVQLEMKHQSTLSYGHGVAGHILYIYICK